jgi:hypothetical protein
MQIFLVKEKQDLTPKLLLSLSKFSITCSLVNEKFGQPSFLGQSPVVTVNILGHTLVFVTWNNTGKSKVKANSFEILADTSFRKTVGFLFTVT